MYYIIILSQSHLTNHNSQIQAGKCSIRTLVMLSNTDLASTLNEGHLHTIYSDNPLSKCTCMDTETSSTWQQVLVL